VARSSWRRSGKSKLGWIEGKNIIIEYRFGEQRNERLPELAAGKRFQEHSRFFETKARAIRESIS